MQLVPQVSNVLVVTPEQWPNDIKSAVDSFMQIAEVVLHQNYDMIINLDTWFMPCFLSRILKDIGLPVRGNYINQTFESFFSHLSQGKITDQYFLPQNYLDSSFPKMHDWHTAWWEHYEGTGGYPQYYLKHCCGFTGEIDMSIQVSPDEELVAQANGKKIVALSMSGSKPSKQYRYSKQLRVLLEKNDFYVWSQFDGSLPMQKTLGKLKASNLLITVPTSAQWLARAVGCPSFLLPGKLSPVILDAEKTMYKTVSCQFCNAATCSNTKQFSCMDISPEQVTALVSSQIREICN